MIQAVDPRLASRIIGVVDLLDGRAVHAIAGNRTGYSDVAFCSGRAYDLAEYYLRIGLKRLYVADLDAITGGPLQRVTLETLCGLEFDQILIDAGWTGDQSDTTQRTICDLAARCSSTFWIAATESCQSTESIAGLIGCVGANRTILGLDFRAGELVTHGPDREAWLNVALESSIAGTVVLDVASVGTAAGAATARHCRQIKQAAPGLPLYSGGGLRHPEDAIELLEAGCEAVLMATALYPTNAKDRLM